MIRVRRVEDRRLYKSRARVDIEDQLLTLREPDAAARDSRDSDDIGRAWRAKWNRNISCDRNASGRRTSWVVRCAAVGLQEKERVVVVDGLAG